MNTQKNSKRKRVSLTISLQPYEDEPIKLIVDYLFALSEDERCRQVTDILVPALLPYALYEAGNCTLEQLRYLCWRSQNSLDNHTSYMCLTLGVALENLQNQTTLEISSLFKVNTQKDSLYQNKSSTPLILRFQPYEGDSMADVAKYLLLKPKDELNKQVTDVLAPALLPYALYRSANHTSKQLSYLCWLAQESFNKHCYYMRLALGVPEPDYLPQVRETQRTSDSIETDTDVNDKDNDTSIEESKVSFEELNNIFGL